MEELEVTISTGILSGIRNLGKNTKVLQITAPISPGNSGGPVLSENGKVIGVISFKITKGESLNFAIPISYRVILF
jgi:S1-C subfamily serine protease